MNLLILVKDMHKLVVASVTLVFSLLTGLHPLLANDYLNVVAGGDTTKSLPNGHKIGVAVGLGASVIGGGSIEGSVELLPQLTARLGLNMFFYRKHLEASLSEFGDEVARHTREALGYDPEADLKVEWQSYMGHLLVDYYPFAKLSSFHLSTGLYWGAPRIHVAGLLRNPDTGKSIVHDFVSPSDLPQGKIEDREGNVYVVRPTDEGGVDLKSVLGNKVKPYIGLGFGSSVPTDRVAVRFSLGAMYSGDWTVKSPNVIEGDIHKLMHLENEEVAKVQYYTQWLLMVGVSINVRLL